MGSAPEMTKKVRPTAYKSHPFEERKRVVELYQTGLGCKRIAQITGLDSSMIRLWLRKYRAGGLDALRPYTRCQQGDEAQGLSRITVVGRDDARFRRACSAYVSSLEPVASIARRFQLDYHSFKYQLERYYPDLVVLRNQLRESIYESALSS